MLASFTWYRYLIIFYLLKTIKIYFEGNFTLSPYKEVPKYYFVQIICKNKKLSITVQNSLSAINARGQLVSNLMKICEKTATVSVWYKSINTSDYTIWQNTLYSDIEQNTDEWSEGHSDQFPLITVSVTRGHRL